MSSLKPPHSVNIILRHTIVGREGLTNFEFDSDKPFRCCLLCGIVFQTARDRFPRDQHDIAVAAIRRQLWADNHAKTHTSKEHADLKASGRTMTPEAAHKLAPYGVVPVSDIVLSDEHEHAALVAPRAPANDAEDH